MRPLDPFNRGESDVDWDKYIGVRSRAQDGTGESHTPLGDPIRWGSQVNMQVLLDRRSESPQLIRVQTENPYARNWQVLGDVSAPQDLWDRATWLPYFEITMGVGQATIIHRMSLRPLIAFCADWYIDGDNGLISKPWVMCGGIVGHAISCRVVSPGVTDPDFADTTISVSGLISPFAAGTGL